MIKKILQNSMPDPVLKIIRKPIKVYYAMVSGRIWKNYIYADRSRPVKKNRVNVYYWKPPHTDNVGDLLSKVVVDYLIEYFSLHNERNISDTRRLFAIGSVIDAAKSDMVVWGSGLHHKTAQIHNVKLDIRAVRGQETKKKLKQSSITCPNVFGDPAVLLPLFFRPVFKKEFTFTIIPHFSRENSYFGKHEGHVTSTLTSDWKGFVSRIVKSDLVISGSLHGLILAEAYGVPAIALTDIDTDWFKYDDYYFSTGRYKYNKARTVEEALNMQPDPIPKFDKMITSLLESFPKDLWNK